MSFPPLFSASLVSGKDFCVNQEGTDPDVPSLRKGIVSKSMSGTEGNPLEGETFWVIGP